MINNKFAGVALALALSLGSTASIAQTPPPPPPAEARTMAMPYVMAAGMSDMFEINSSQIALQKSQNKDVRKFATMLIKHHQMTTAATMKAAKKGGLNPPPPMLDPNAQPSINELQSASATDFDRLYIGQQIPAHQAALDLHRTYAASGDQAALRTSARTAVPIVQQHLDAAMKLQTKMAAMPGM